jgi:hypothetical protein
MARSITTVSAGNIVGEFVRILPDSIREELDIYADSLPQLNLVGALNLLDDKELQAALRSCDQTWVGPQLTRLGVDNNKGRPRVPGLIIAKLARGLSRGDMSAKLVLQMLTGGVYRLLLVRAAELTNEFPPGWYREDLDTPVLRALAMMGAHRLNDPSAPWALAGMVRDEDPAVKILVKPDVMKALELSTGQFLLQAKPEKDQVLSEWVRRRAMPPTAQDNPVPTAARRTTQKSSVGQHPASCSPGTGATIGTGHAPPSASSALCPAPASAPVVVSPAPRGKPAQRQTGEHMTEGQELDVDAALSLLGQQFPEVVSVLLPRLRKALVETCAPDDRDLGTLADLRALLLRTSQEIATRTGTSQLTSLRDLQQTWTAHQDQQNSRGTLRRLATCIGPEAISASLDWVRGTAHRLAVGWEPQDSTLVTDLLSLAELVVRGQADDADDDDLIAQSLQLKDRLPTEAGKAVSAAARGRIRLGDSVHIPEASAPSLEIATAPSKGLASSTTWTARFTSAPDSAHAADTAEAEVSPVDRAATGSTSPAEAAEVITASTVPTPASTDNYPTDDDSEPVPGDLRVSLQVVSTVTADPTSSSSSASVPEQAAAHPDSHDPAVEVAAALITAGRLGLAQHLLAQSSLIDQSDAVALAALALQLRGPSGACGLEIADRLAVTSEESLTEDTTCALLATGSLTTFALLSGSPDAASLLAKLPEHLDPAWAKLARLAGEVAASGALSRTALNEATDTSHLTRAAKDAAERCAERLASVPGLRAHRANEIISVLRSNAHQLGDVLARAARNDISQAASVTKVVRDLTRSRLREQVRAIERSSRASGGKDLSDTIVNEIVEVLYTDWGSVARWAEAAGFLERPGTGHDWQSHRLAALRSQLTEHADDLRGALSSYVTRGEPLLTAACGVAEQLLDRLSELAVGGTTLTGTEATPVTVLDLELLKLPDTSFDVDQGTVRDDKHSKNLDSLLAIAAEPDFRLALRRRLERDDFVAATRIARDMTPADAQHIGELQAQRVEAIGHDLDRLRLLVVSARNSATGDDELDTLDVELGQMELLLKANSVDLANVRTALDDAQERMRDLRVRTIDAFHARLNAVPNLEPAEHARLCACLERDEFDQVDFELSLLGTTNPEILNTEPTELPAFFPAMVEQMRDGIIDSLLSTVREGGEYGPASYAMSPKRREDSINGLTQWCEIPALIRRGGSVPIEELSAALRPALRVLGFDMSPEARLAYLDFPWARARDRRHIELKGARPVGQALVPAFGSQANGTYRLLLSSAKPSVAELTDLRDVDGGTGPLIICYFGTLGVTERLELAASWTDATRRPTIIVDDAVLAWAASRVDPFPAVMRVTLPFTATAPYSPVKTANVPVEMFYGRDIDERRILDPQGPSIVYGGRGMGKSALLSVIQRRSRRANAENLKVIWLEMDRSREIDAPEVIWGKLADELVRQNVTSTARSQAQMKHQNRCERILNDWLKANPDGRILILIDEADAFFAADSQREFRVTSDLFALVTKHPRTKAVFAGLHGVAHHHSVGNNPFSPSGALPIGPLERRHAYGLLTAPLEALGFQIHPDEANRILMHCNAQPYLLQMFAANLLERLLTSRRKGVSALPIVVDRSTVDAVYNDPQLREQIHRAFKITLELDARFSVIANLLAVHAHRNGTRTPLTEAELLEGCRQAWPEGFADTAMASFRELLNELEQLGILAPADLRRGGRTLRSHAVLQSMGPQAQVELALREVRNLSLPEEAVRQQYRPTVGKHSSPGPLTTAQIADLAGRKGNRTRIVVGSHALGLDRVADALADPTHEPVLRDVRVVKGKEEYRHLLRTGASGETRLTVVSELWELTTSRASCGTSLNEAMQLLPNDMSYSRAVVLIVGPGNANWLRELPTQDEFAESVVPLERFTLRNLPLHWRDNRMLQELGSAALAPRVLEVTGGWPGLVDELVRLARSAGAVRALEQLEQRQQQPEWAHDWLEQAGVLHEQLPELAQLVRQLEDLGDACPLHDLLELAAGTDVDSTTITLADWFGIVDRVPDDRVQLAPLIATAWRSWSSKPG